MERFVIPIQDKFELISPADHKTLFQNIDEVSKTIDTNFKAKTQLLTDFKIIRRYPRSIGPG